MVSSDQEGEAAYVCDHWDSALKAVSLLTAGHAAIILACVTVLKEFSSLPQVRGMGEVVFIATIGVMLGAVAYACGFLVRQTKVKRARGTSKGHFLTWLAIYVFALFFSFAGFLLEVFVIGIKLSSL
jgi:chromate transport protein ChrA